MTNEAAYRLAEAMRCLAHALDCVVPVLRNLEHRPPLVGPLPPSPFYPPYAAK